MKELPVDDFVFIHPSQEEINEILATEWDDDMMKQLRLYYNFMTDDQKREWENKERARLEKKVKNCINKPRRVSAGV